MSDYSVLANQVAQLTQRLNNIEAQGRKIPELPMQDFLNPASLIHVSIGGISQYISVQMIITAILSYKFNQLISIAGDITVSGNDITIPPAVWAIENVQYSTTTNTVINVPYAATGYTRNDIFVADKFGVIYRVSGPETEGISPTPNPPIDTVLVTSVSVTDSTIGTPAPPLLSNISQYINKVFVTSLTQVIPLPENTVITGGLTFNGGWLDPYYWERVGDNINLKLNLSPPYTLAGDDSDQLVIYGITQNI